MLMDWFNVNKAGLAKLLEKRGKAFAVCEVVANAWDTDAARVDVTLAPVDGTRSARVTVEDDDPRGFANLTDSFTLFAESVRKGDPLKRGRFNLGEKLVLALCTEAVIASTTGTVTFSPKGRRRSCVKRERGSVFTGIIPMTKAEQEAAFSTLRAMLPPHGIITTVNGEALPERTPIATVKAFLQTEIADEHGIMRTRWRDTTIAIHEPLPGEAASVYEMGIPVVASGDKWHLDVGQKLPVGFDRDNLPSWYMRALRVAVLNATAEKLTKDDANAAWVRDAGTTSDATDAATRRIMDLRFGERRVIYDPSDPEANALAVTKGYTVVHGGMLNAGEWDNVRRSGAALPAGQVTPSPKPFSPDGSPLKVLDEADWTSGMDRATESIRDIARELLKTECAVTIANDPGWHFRAAYGKNSLTLNLNRLGYSWFDDWPHADGIQLLIHEFAHHYEPNHLSDEYHETLCRLGAEFTVLAAHRAGLFRFSQKETP
jgi:hypothetical protein